MTYVENLVNSFFSYLRVGLHDLIWFEIWTFKSWLLYETLIIARNIFDSFPSSKAKYCLWNRGQMKNVKNGFMMEELNSFGKKTGNKWWGNAKEMGNKENSLKSLSNWSIKQSIYWIRVPSQKWKSSCKKRDNWEETSINN